ncbi:MAG: ATP-binding cassette domain-containing protein [Desulfosarcina sp.]|nr:ATP-binding cassette domain-containing protein [Desulfobacterales bacterium]
MIDLRAITFAYRDQSPLFRDFSLNISRGEILAVIGPSGCGKTSLLYLLAGLYRPGLGGIRIDGRPLERPRPQTGLILQDHGLLPWATVTENAALGLKIRRFYGPDGKHTPRDFEIDAGLGLQKVKSWLQRLGLDSLHDFFPGQLSRGQRQRTAIARTMTLDPDVLLMDEPFSALDAPTSERLQHLILMLKRESGLTTVIVTHRIEEDVRMGDRILVLNGGTNRQTRLVTNPGSAPDGDFGAGRRALFRYVYLPASLPAVLTALRVSIGTAVAVLFIAEQSLTTYGLGYYIVVETYQVLLYPQMYAGILGMSLLGLLLYFVVFGLERRINRHRHLEGGPPS